MELELLYAIFLLFKVLLNHIRCKLNVESGGEGARIWTRTLEHTMEHFYEILQLIHKRLTQVYCITDSSLANVCQNKNNYWPAKDIQKILNYWKYCKFSVPVK